MAKLNAREMMYPSAGDNQPGGRADAFANAGTPAPGEAFLAATNHFALPAVSIFTTVSATFAEASFIAFSVASLRSGFLLRE